MNAMYTEEATSDSYFCSSCFSALLPAWAGQSAQQLCQSQWVSREPQQRTKRLKLTSLFTIPLKIEKPTKDDEADLVGNEEIKEEVSGSGHGCQKIMILDHFTSDL